MPSSKLMVDEVSQAVSAGEEGAGEVLGRGSGAVFEASMNVAARNSIVGMASSLALTVSCIETSSPITGLSRLCSRFCSGNGPMGWGISMFLGEVPGSPSFVVPGATARNGRNTEQKRRAFGNIGIKVGNGLNEMPDL